MQLCDRDYCLGVRQKRGASLRRQGDNVIGYDCEWRNRGSRTADRITLITMPVALCSLLGRASSSHAMLSTHFPTPMQWLRGIGRYTVAASLSDIGIDMVVITYM